jgi:hypothetical protein
MTGTEHGYGSRVPQSCGRTFLEFDDRPSPCHSLFVMASILTKQPNTPRVLKDAVCGVRCMEKIR